MCPTPSSAPCPAPYSIGIEEEFFVFDAQSRRAITRADKPFLGAIKKRLGGAVMTEMLQSQVEVVTPVCEHVDQAREYLALPDRVLLRSRDAHQAPQAEARQPLDGERQL